jgi:hypothetical protein
MPTTINRIAYFAQSGLLTYGTGQTIVLPINSANIEVSRPIEAVTTFGTFNALTQAQTNLTTCKSSLKGYLGSGSGLTTLSAAVLSGLITSTQTGTGAGGIAIVVQPGGFTMTGILTNIGLDISMGSFGMFDLGFAGVGNPTVVPPNTTHATAGTAPLSIAPITTMSVGTNGLLSGAAATSIKFAYDLPTDVLSALGDNPNAAQGNLVSVIATKAPYKTSLSVEGYGVDPTIVDTALASGVSIGTINIILPKGKVTSRSFNQAAGQVSASFSYSAEDVSATLTDVLISGYQQSNANISTFGPAYGA